MVARLTSHAFRRRNPQQPKPGRQQPPRRIHQHQPRVLDGGRFADDVVVAQVAVDLAGERDGVPGDVARFALFGGALHGCAEVHHGQQHTFGVGEQAKSIWSTSGTETSTLRRIELRRAQANCTYGPVSPSKLSIASQSNLTSLMREFLRSLKTIAETPTCSATSSAFGRSGFFSR
jgi:hypothetical protein